MALRICIVSHLYPVDAGDYKGVHVHQMASALAARGHSVVVITPRRVGSAAREERDGVRIERYRYWGWWRGWQLSELAGYSPLTLASLFLIGIWKTLMCVLRNRCDVIHAYWVVPGGFIAAVAGALTRRPVVATAAGTDLNMTGQRRLVRWFVRMALKGTGRVIAAGSDMKRIAMELGGRNVIVLPSCFMDLERKPAAEPINLPGKRGGRLLYVGSLDRPKRVDILIDAFAKVRRERAGAVLIIAGTGNDLHARKLEAIAKARGVRDGVHFLGPVPPERIDALMAEADVFVHCSEHEGLPVAIIEALRAGLPVIARDVGGVSDLVRDGENGYLVENLSENEFADRMLMLLEHEQVRGWLARGAREFARDNLDGGKVVLKIEQIYTELMT